MRSTLIIVSNLRVSLRFAFKFTFFSFVLTYTHKSDAFHVCVRLPRPHLINQSWKFSVWLKLPL